MFIIDRRLNSSGKSLENRQRFLRRAKALVRQAVRDSSTTRGIRDMDKGGEVAIPVGSVREPRLRHADKGGRRQNVLPGNKDFVTGDTIPKPQGGGGGGKGQQGSPDGEGEDDFRFVLTREEYLDLFLDDLELPDLAKRKIASVESVSPQRAGFAVTGSPANLAIGRTMRNSLSRRFALRRPKPEELVALERELAELEAQPGGATERRQEILIEIDQLRSRMRVVPYIDPIDIRYRRFQPVPKPVAQAVMFCLMDTSASMTEHLKDLAKRFFSLLYLFLSRRYKNVTVVFIRHTDRAEEVDEDTFFHSRETGGTVVSSALEEMVRVVAARFNPEDWNIYVAQASDGDNSMSDSDKTAKLLKTDILPVCQYFAYIEVGRDSAGDVGFMQRSTDLWRSYESVVSETPHMAMCRVNRAADIYPVFRKLFERQSGDRKSAGPIEASSA